MLVANETTSISITIAEEYDGSEVWTGVVVEGEDSVSIDWVPTDESEFSIDVPNTQSNVIIVILKKGAVPIKIPVTSETISNGVSIEFEDGMSIVGSVVTKKRRITDFGRFVVSYP